MLEATSGNQRQAWTGTSENKTSAVQATFERAEVHDPLGTHSKKDILQENFSDWLYQVYSDNLNSYYSTHHSYQGKGKLLDFPAIPG